MVLQLETAASAVSIFIYFLFASFGDEIADVDLRKT
jgi:hypothetical protein